MRARVCVFRDVILRQVLRYRERAQTSVAHLNLLSLFRLTELEREHQAASQIGS